MSCCSDDPLYIVHSTGLRTSLLWNSPQPEVAASQVLRDDNNIIALAIQMLRSIVLYGTIGTKSLAMISRAWLLIMKR